MRITYVSILICTFQVNLYQIMAQPSDTSTLQDSMIKKLQLLQTQNNTLREERQVVESNISNYVKSISELTDQLSALELKNKELVQTNYENARKCRKLELDLQRSSQQYKTLYHFVYIDRGLDSRKVVQKEIQLSNQLNEIQYDGYSKMILSLKQKINEKNKIVIDLNTENTKLKETILQTTWEYQEKIAQLKEEMLILTIPKSVKPEKDMMIAQENIYEAAASRAQYQCLQKELQIVEIEYAKQSKELIDCKSELNHYKQEAEWLKITLDNNNISREVDMDLTEIRSILQENVTLKKRLDRQVYRLNLLLKTNPSLMNQLQEIDLTNPFDDIQEKYETLQKVLKTQEKEISQFKTSILGLTESRNSKQQELLKYKAITIKTIDKLKNIIKAYVPCVNLYGYSDYGLDEQQCKFVQESGANLAKEYDKLSAVVLQKNGDIRKLQERKNKLNETVKTLENELEEEKKKSKALSEENKKIVSSLDSLTEQWNHWNDRNGFMEQQQDSPHFQERFNEDPDQRVSSARLESICDLVLALQKDRVTLLQCIRKKDLLIAEANAQLNVLRNSNKPKVFSFPQLSQIQGDHRSSSEPEKFAVHPHHDDELLKAQVEQYNKLKRQISSMAELYQNEIYLLQEECSKNYNQLHLKYTKLMADNHELQKRYERLQKINEEILEKPSERQKEAESIHSEHFSGVELQDNLPKDEKNVITETTIQIINELLKKYQKQFSRFTTLYQSELVKTKELKRSSLQEDDQKSTQNFLQAKIKLIEDIIQQKNETIRLQENELNEKDIIIQSQKDNFDKAERLYEQRLADLEVRLNQTSSELSILKNKGVEVLQLGTSAEAVSSKSMTFILSALAAKNQEISQLKESLNQEKEKNSQLTVLVEDLESRVQDQYSQLQIQEFRQLKKLVEEGDLAEVLEKASDLLQSRQEKQRMQE